MSLSVYGMSLTIKNHFSGEKWQESRQRHFVTQTLQEAFPPSAMLTLHNQDCEAWACGADSGESDMEPPRTTAQLHISKSEMLK